MASGYAPPVVITSSDGRRWRQCAGAAIINSRGELLVGERLKIANAWNCPQGGVDAGESLVGAASREADEEVGLVVGTHIAPIATMGPAGGVQYEAKGWLRKEGFAGQQIHWTLFRTISAVGDREVGDVADLQGRNGEAAEFKQVRWMPIEQVVDSMWEASPRKTHTHTHVVHSAHALFCHALPLLKHNLCHALPPPKHHRSVSPQSPQAKRAPYEALQKWAVPIICEWSGAISRVDLSGKWERDVQLASPGLVEALKARGHTEEEAAIKAREPYVQEYVRTDTAGVWRIRTYTGDGSRVRREHVYPLGAWEERFGPNETNVIFGAAGGVAQRWTAWLAEPDADGGGREGGVAGGDGECLERQAAMGMLTALQVAHVTVSETPLGFEETRRFLRKGRLVLRRTFTKAGEAFVSEEVFDRKS